MPDDMEARILAAIADLKNDVTRFRTDLMARMDRQQTRMDHIDEHLTLGLGHGDDAMERAQSASNSSRIHAEQIRSLQKLVRSLEARIQQIEEK